jgi:hypothetical protein
MFTIQDFRRQYVKEHFPELTVQEQKEVLQELSSEARLAGLTPEARLAGLPPEARLAGLTPEQIQKYLDELKTRKSPTRKSRRKK